MFIKSIEQLKHHSPGEIGKLLGLDRIPEARCLRSIVKELCSQEMASEWNAHLSEEWINQEDTIIYYIDGHVQVYHGHLANLGKKHVSRQKLCLPGMVEFWVNNAASHGPQVKVNSISPGWIDVSAAKKKAKAKQEVLSEEDHLQHPAGRVGTADDIANMVLFLLATENDFITGQNFVVDGGMTTKMIYV